MSYDYTNNGKLTDHRAAIMNLQTYGSLSYGSLSLKQHTTLGKMIRDYDAYRGPNQNSFVQLSNKEIKSAAFNDWSHHYANSHPESKEIFILLKDERNRVHLARTPQNTHDIKISVASRREVSPAEMLKIVDSMPENAVPNQVSAVVTPPEQKASPTVVEVVEPVGAYVSNKMENMSAASSVFKKNHPGVSYVGPEIVDGTLGRGLGIRLVDSVPNANGVGSKTKNSFTQEELEIYMKKLEEQGLSENKNYIVKQNKEGGFVVYARMEGVGMGFEKGISAVQSNNISPVATAVKAAAEISTVPTVDSVPTSKIEKQWKGAGM